MNRTLESGSERQGMEETGVENNILKDGLYVLVWY